MEYLLINRSSLQALCSSIGWKDESGHYELDPDCLRTLNSIEKELLNENVTTRNIRLSLGLSRIIERDLICILETIDAEIDPPIIRVTVRLLVNLTLPPECLLPTSKHQVHNDLLTTRIKQLQKMLLSAKKAFVASNKATSALINTMKHAPSTTAAVQSISSNSKLEQATTSQPSATDACTTKNNNTFESDVCKVDKIFVKDCLLLLRNLLHVPDKVVTDEDKMKINTNNSNTNNNPRNVLLASKDDWLDAQRRMIWNLLVQGLDNTLLFLMSMPYRQSWTCNIVQLIALLYKNQPVSKMSQFISTKNSASDCSEDDVESDHTLSAQRSSSTSILSDSSSSKEGGGTQSSGSKNDSGYYQQTESEKTCSDSGCLEAAAVSARSASQPDWVIMEEEGQVLDRHGDSDRDSGVEGSSTGSNRSSNGGSEKTQMIERMDTSNNWKPGKNQETCKTKMTRAPIKTLSSSKSSINSQTIVLGKDDKQQSKEEEEENRMVEDTVSAEPEANQTSGFSGSSEEDDRRMHKVMKPHQRSNTKPSESEDSDDSDYMAGKVVRCHHHPPNVTRKIKLSLPVPKSPNCCPSICMEAALAAALAQVTFSTGTNTNNNDNNGNSGAPTSEIKTIAPWEKKKTCGSKSSSIGNESIAPSDKDICSLLKEFTLKFVHNFFPCLVLDLSKELLLQRENSMTIDISHLLWLLSYFLKISTSIDLSYHHISPILQTDMFGLLVFNGIMINEELELISTEAIGLQQTSLANSSDFPGQQDECYKKLTRKLQLLIAALKEMIVTVSNYIGKSGSSEDERRSLEELRGSLSLMTDLRQLFLLLVRCYSPLIASKSLLVDIIVTHHHLLILLDEPNGSLQFNLVSHLRQFATIKIMEQYGRVLENFQTNSEFVNNCVFTVMHHVAGDLRNPECLFQPIILKTYSLIMESDLELLDAWEDMMEYVMNRFVKAATRSNAARLTSLLEGGGKDDQASVTASTHRTRDATIYSSNKSYTSDESSVDLSNLDSNRDKLYWLYLQYEQTNDPISCILEVLMEEQNLTIGRQELISQLMVKGIISQEEYHGFMEGESGSCSIRNNIHRSVAASLSSSPSSSTASIPEVKMVVEEKRREEIEVTDETKEEMIEIDLLLGKLAELGLDDQLSWISSILIGACNAKMCQVKGARPADKILQPTAYFSNLLGQPMPIVPYNEKQELAMNSKPMLELLQRIGFHLPNDTGKLYLRVPVFFTPDILFKIACKISQPDFSELIFPPEEVLESRST